MAKDTSEQQAPDTGVDASLVINELVAQVQQLALQLAIARGRIKTLEAASQ